MKDNKGVTNRLISQNIDNSILKYIKESLEGIDDKLEIAIAIYIKLSELLWYSSTFVVENDYDLVEDLNKITVDNNEVVCLHWAVLYARLLDMYGVPNRLCGDDEHLSVKVMVGKYVISADATEYGVEDREYLLADLTNTKLGLKIRNFATLSDAKNKELDVIIDRVYEKLGIRYYDMTKFNRVLEKFKKYNRKRVASSVGKKHIGTRDDVLYRIRFINKFYNMSLKLREVERMQFFAKYYKSVFEEYSYDNCRCLTLCELGKEYHLVRLIVVECYDKEDYYFLETENGFIEYDKDSLIDEFIRRNIVFKYEICGVLGFKDEDVKILSKSNK